MPRPIQVLFGPKSLLIASLIGGGYLIDSGSRSDHPGPAPAHGGPVYVLAYAPDGSKLAWGGLHDHVRFCLPSTGEATGELDEDVVRTSALAYSPDARALATAAVEGLNRPWNITVWEIGTGEKLAILHGHTDQVTDLAYSADGNSIASASLDGTVGIWDAATGRLRCSIRADGRPFYRVAFEPGSTSLLTAGDDGRIRRWNVESGRPLGVVVAVDEPVRCMALSDDGSTLATWELGRREIKLWDVKTGQLRARARGHTNYIQALAFAPKRPLLASASLDGTVRLWDAHQGKSLATLRPAPAGSVHSLAFTPDGTMLAVGGKSSRVGLWNVDRAQAGIETAQGEIQLSRR